MTDKLRDLVAEQVWGVLAAAQRDGVTDLNVVAHAAAGNVLRVVERHAAAVLREAADAAAQLPAAPTNNRGWWAAKYLRDRADALAADGTEPHPAHRHDETETGR